MHSFRVSGGEERHQFFLSEKIAARLEEEHQRETPTKTPKPTKRSHQRKDFDNTTDAALLSLLSLERDLKTYYSGFIFIRVCLVSVFILFKVKRQRHLFPSFFTSESRQRDKGVNLFRTINFRLSFLQWLFFVKNARNAKRVTTIIIIIIIIIINENAR